MTKNLIFILVLASSLQAMQRDKDTLILPPIDAQNPDKSAKKIDHYFRKKRKKASVQRIVKVQINIGDNFYLVHAPLTKDGTPAIIKALLTETSITGARSLKLPRITT